ncbi:hypothetical protein FRC04_003709 [Tulasnella sp. 424]|nr:hypothetical protein FRC04_003709 [Tulasnella sp. 424]KAG8977038.1 hypothetical protein FRC05_002559 [Tulasnella sp. 425]
MVSVARTFRSLRRVGLREWWRQLQYIGDAKSGRFVGMDQSVLFHPILSLNVDLLLLFMHALHLSSIGSETATTRTEMQRKKYLADTVGSTTHNRHDAQHEFNASQVPPEWHSWISHIRKDPPTEDVVMQGYEPPWKTPYNENLTGTRGAFKTYNTAAPKIIPWAPKAIPRGE